jgi:hypothetical protein
MANSLHLKILMRGFRVWNRWRRAYPRERPDLRGADLRGWDLAFYQLSGTDFLEARLRGTDFSTEGKRCSMGMHPSDWVMPGDCLLEDLWLWDTDLREANFCKAAMTGSDFSRAEASGARFDGAKLGGCKFFRANLAGANFAGAELRGADLRRARVVGANFVGVDFCEVDREGADFSGTRLTGTFTGEAVIPGEWLREQAPGFSFAANRLHLTDTWYFQRSDQRARRRELRKHGLPPNPDGAALNEIVQRRAQIAQQRRKWEKFIAVAEPGDTLWRYHPGCCEPGTSGFALVRDGIPFAEFMLMGWNSAGT